jgi:hypothetical protein
MNGHDNLRDIAYEAFVYAYPMLEQVKTINGMFTFMGLATNEPTMVPKLPMDNVGMPIVCPNLTSMTGGIFLDISHGPVTVEVPEVKDRYVVYQCIDIFTHNFFYMGTRANNGESGRFVFHNKHQQPPDNDATPVLMEGDFAIIVIRIDIANDDEFEYVCSIQDAIRVVDSPSEHRTYPTYDEETAFSPEFVEYLNELIAEVPDTEMELFERFGKIGILSDVTLTDDVRNDVQAGIDAAYADIQAQSKTATALGNGWVGGTTVFGTREFLNGDYLSRAIGAHFGLWGNSKEEANYFLGYFDGEGEIVFKKEDLPPLKDIGFWSITAHDGEFYVHTNPYDSYVLTTDKMKFDEDGGITFKFSSEPEEGNWLYASGGGLGVLLRAYQADPSKIEAYVPPPFIRR